jgi:EAL domain-containing protein (putative c-di-GMP-specific phosphodiesterase class I)
MQKSEVRPFKAMILEDHEFQRKIARQVLKICGATAIVEAANGGLTSEALVIEVTETVAMTDLGHSLETLARLRMKGFGLSIDDYAPASRQCSN